MFIEQIRRSAFLFASVLLFASCAEALTEDNLSNVENGVLMTKVINTPSASIDGSLLLRLTDEAAADINSGGKSLVDELSQNVAITSISPIFTIRPEKEDVARRHNLHRWFKVEFDGADNATAAARLATFSQVEMIQYNKVVAPASDLKSSPYVPSLQEMSASTSATFNDPYLKDQWHYINTGSSEIANSTYAGGDIAVKDAWTLTAGDSRVVVAVLDGPVKYDHPDLAPNMWKNASEVPGDGIDNDRNGYADDVYGWNCDRDTCQIVYNVAGESGHGTHVAGIIGGKDDTITGVATNAQLAIFKVFFYNDKEDLTEIYREKAFRIWFNPIRRSKTTLNRNN